MVSQGADFRADDNFAVRWASCNGHFEVVYYLISQGADFRADNDSALWWASSNKHFKVVDYLLLILYFNRLFYQKIEITIIKNALYNNTNKLNQWIILLL